MAPVICVEGPAAAADEDVADAVALVEAVADEDVADVVAEDDAPLVLLVWLHAEPIRANPAIAMENAAVRFVISRISVLSNWAERPSACPTRMLLRFVTT
ncbi:MAG: hypothetical protein WBR28_14310 [Mycobacterium sp.]